MLLESEVPQRARGVLGYCDTTISGNEMCWWYFQALSTPFLTRLKCDPHISLSEIVVSIKIKPYGEDDWLQDIFIGTVEAGCQGQIVVLVEDTVSISLQ